MVLTILPKTLVWIKMEKAISIKLSLTEYEVKMIQELSEYFNYQSTNKEQTAIKESINFAYKSFILKDFPECLNI